MVCVQLRTPNTSDFKKRTKGKEKRYFPLCLKSYTCLLLPQMLSAHTTSAGGPGIRVGPQGPENIRGGYTTSRDKVFSKKTRTLKQHLNVQNRQSNMSFAVPFCGMM